MQIHNKTFKTLIIDDHVVIAKAYRNILSSNSNFTFSFKFAVNCDEAIKQLNHSRQDLVFLDLSLPASRDKKFISGEDIGLWLRKDSPPTKIIIITFISDSERVRSIIKTINPKGFLIKSDFESLELIDAVEAILAGDDHYYNQTIKDHSKDQCVDGHIIDDIDRKILYHLSMGEKTKDLPELVHLSLRSIEERKVKLRDLFGINKDSKSNLIKEAKNRRII